MRTEFLVLLSAKALLQVCFDSVSDGAGHEFYVLLLFCSGGESVMVR